MDYFDSDSYKSYEEKNLEELKIVSQQLIDIYSEINDLKENFIKGIAIIIIELVIFIIAFCIAFHLS
jgi:hypothetical protein